MQIDYVPAYVDTPRIKHIHALVLCIYIYSRAKKMVNIFCLAAV